MIKRLIIAEKHSVAQAIASAIGGTQTKQDNLMQSKPQEVTNVYIQLPTDYVRSSPDNEVSAEWSWCNKGLNLHR